MISKLQSRELASIHTAAVICSACATLLFVAENYGHGPKTGRPQGVWMSPIADWAKTQLE